MLSIGIIGIGGHSKRICKILNDRKDISFVKFYHPTKQTHGIAVTNDIAALLECDAIFIVSPNEFHYEHLMYLEVNYSGYIFCEKPPVTDLKQLSSLKLNSGKVYFNFNYRFSEYYFRIKEEIDSGRLGAPLTAFVAITHGLAFKQSYLSNWRSASNANQMGIVETVSIHFIDLFIFLFGPVLYFDINGCNQSGKGQVFDTATIKILFKNNLHVTVFVSYAAPFSERLVLYGTNGILDINDDVITTQHPRDSFDKEGFFIGPPKTINFSKDIYLKSLEKSIDYFLGVCKLKETFPSRYLDTSIATCRVTLRS